MKVSMSFKNVKHSSEVQQHIERKTERLAKYYDGNLNVKWLCSFKEGKYWVEAYITGPKFSFHASSRYENMYKSFDLTLDKLERQIWRKKDKVKSRRSKHSEVSHLDPEHAWLEYDEHDLGIAS